MTETETLMTELVSLIEESNKAISNVLTTFPPPLNSALAAVTAKHFEILIANKRFEIEKHFLDKKIKNPSF